MPTSVSVLGSDLAAIRSTANELASSDSGALVLASGVFVLILIITLLVTLGVLRKSDDDLR